MTARRRKLWALMVKKEICKVMFISISLKTVIIHTHTRNLLDIIDYIYQNK